MRRIRKSPGFAFLAILTLALAIGANTTIFSAIDALILRPLPGISHPDQLVFFSQGENGQNQSYPNYRDFRDRAKAFSGIIAYRVAVMALNRGGSANRIWGYEASGNYFQTLGVKPVVGRFFTPAEDIRPGANPYTVLSYATWLHRFGGDPAVAGKTVKINGLDYTILGVTPKDFIGTELLYRPEIWVPMSMEAQIEPGNNWLDEPSDWDIWVIGRIKAGLNHRQAQADIDNITAQLIRERPKNNEGMRVYLVQPGLFGTYMRGPVTSFVTVIMGIAGLVLLLACINLASSLLARAIDRRKEVAIRLALGCSRMRLIRQFMTENFVLAVAGGAAGVLLASWLAALISAARLPIDFPLNTALSLDTRVLAFAVATSIITVLLFGLAPAMYATRPDLVPALKNESGLQRSRRWELRDLLVAGQIAMCVVLLAGSVLVVHSLRNALKVDIGYNPQNAASVWFDLGIAGYGEARGQQFQKRLLARVKTLPGIESASLSNAIPLSLDVSHTAIYAYDKPIPKRGAAALTMSSIYYYAGPDFFHTLQTKIIEGRDFNERDTPTSPKVVIVNQALARMLFPNEDALGKRVWQSPGAPAWQIVGIVEDGKYESLNDEHKPVIFWPLYQRYNSTTTLVARSQFPADQLVAMLRSTVRQMDPTLPLSDAGTLESHLALQLIPARAAATTLGGFGLLAVVLVAIGVYGAMAYAVARRTREIGIRMAIGASRANVLSLVIERSLAVLAAGTACGLAAALAVSRFFGAVLYGVSPKDPLTYVAVILLIAIVALIACFVPAQRAMAVDPANALRQE